VAKVPNPKRHFPQVPKPWQRIVVQTNGDLTIIQDANNRYWLVNSRFRKVYPERFESLKAAAREASSVSFVLNPASSSPEWKEVSS